MSTGEIPRDSRARRPPPRARGGRKEAHHFQRKLALSGGKGGAEEGRGEAGKEVATLFFSSSSSSLPFFLGLGAVSGRQGSSPAWNIDFVSGGSLLFFLGSPTLFLPLSPPGEMDLLPKKRLFLSLSPSVPPSFPFSSASKREV